MEKAGLHLANRVRYRKVHADPRSRTQQGMTNTNTARQPKGVPVGGQFAPSSHPESSVSLAEPATKYDPEAVLTGLLPDLRDLYRSESSDIYYASRQALSDGVSHAEILNGFIQKNHGGRCAIHVHRPAQSSPESYCTECRIAFMVEARINPKPQPVPLTEAPTGSGPSSDEYLEAAKSSETEYDSETSSRTKTVMDGDEKFHAAIRDMFGAASDAEVEIVQEEFHDWTNYTEEHETSIEITCDGVTREYDGMAQLMRSMDRQLRPEPYAMALRFMQATRAERPLLHGTAAVYLKRPYGSPELVFGKIHNVFSSGADPSIEFMHTDGRRESLYFSRISAITETDQSGIYDEGNAK